MKRLTGTQKLSAVLGAGLLIAVASGSVFAMHTVEERDIRQIEIRKEKESGPLTSPLPMPTIEPTSEPHDEVEFTGTVEVMASDMWVVGGRTVAVTAATEIKPGLNIGMQAKVHAMQQADGSLWAREIGPAQENDNDNGNVNANDDNGNNNDNGNVNANEDHSNSNDDHNGNVNSNEDHHNSNENGNVNANEDHSNSNDHHNSSSQHNGDNSVNSNDDHGNSNDKHSSTGNDQHGGHDHDS